MKIFQMQADKVMNNVIMVFLHQLGAKLNRGVKRGFESRSVKLGLLVFVLGFAVVFQTGCTANQNNGNNSDQQSNEQALMKMHVDSLWTKNKQIRSKFRLKVDELKERKTSMLADLQVLKFANPAWVSTRLTEDQRLAINKWEAIARIYKHMVDRYEHAVIDAEEKFYQIKAMEKLVDSNQYSGKRNQFKKDYKALDAELSKLLVEVTEIDMEIGAVEPDFHRLDPQMEEIMEKAEADSKRNHVD